MNIITIIGILIVCAYSLIQILSFYGIGTETYGPYVLFYGFLAATSLVLPHEVPKV
jgi:hypothetical protein